MDPGDVTYVNNRAAARLEAGDLDGALKDCDDAVARGREARADYKVVARALARRGTVLGKMGRLEEAVEAYQKARGSMGKRVFECGGSVVGPGHRSPVPTRRGPRAHCALTQLHPTHPPRLSSP